MATCRPDRALLLPALSALIAACLALPACTGGPSVVEAVQEPDILVTAGAVPILFHRASGPWYVYATGDSGTPASKVRDGIRVYLAEDAWKRLRLDEWTIESSADTLTLRLASAEFRLKPARGRAVVVEGSQVHLSQEVYEQHRGILGWLSEERARLRAAPARDELQAPPADGTPIRGHIWRLE